MNEDGGFGEIGVVALGFPSHNLPEKKCVEEREC